MLLDRIAELERQLTREKAETARMREQAKLEAASSFEGLSRATIFNDSYHESHPDLAHVYLGMGSWRQIQACLVALFGDDIFSPNYTDMTRIPRKFSLFEECVITKWAFTNAGCTLQKLVSIFSSSTVTIWRILRKWSPFWGGAGDLLSQLHVTEEYARQVYPESYKAAGLDNVFGVVDGKDIMAETSRVHSGVTRGQRSNKMKHSAFRVITWSMPDGLSFLHSPLFLARLSEKRIVELMECVSGVFPAGWQNLGDRGFADVEIYFQNMNLMLHPHFLGKRKCFSPAEITHDWRISKLRYTSEVVYSRLTSEESLYGVVRRETFSRLSYIVSWGHARNNLAKPLQQPSSIPPEYFEENPARFHKEEEEERLAAE